MEGSSILIYLISVVAFIILAFVVKAIFGMSFIQNHLQYQTELLESIAQKQGCDMDSLKSKRKRIFE